MTWARAVRAALAVGLAASTVAACGNDAEYADTLRTFDDERGEANTVIDLPGGNRFSAGSPDGHEIVVQRYDAGADGWSSPQTIHAEVTHWTHDVRVSHRDGTVAVSADYWTEEVLDDDYSPDHSMGAVCVETTCTLAVESPAGTLAGVWLTADGRHATFGQGGRRLAAWAGGTTWTRHELEGLGPRADVATRDDGSFVGLTGRRVGDGCTWTLHTTEPQGYDFTEQATSAPTPRSGRCDPLIDNSGYDGDVDRVGLWVESLSGTITFVREDGAWAAVAPPATYDTVVDTGGRTTMSPVFDDGKRPRAVLFSPDTREIWAQTRWEHDVHWTKAHMVFTVPDGMACRRGDIERLDHASLVARLECFGADRFEGKPETTLALLSYNDWAWQGGLVQDAGRVASGGMRIVFAGNPGMVLDEDTGDPGRMALPFPEPALDPLELSTDWLVRVAPRFEDGRCLATLWTADSPGAASWQEGPSFPVPAYETGCPELDTDRTYGNRPKVTTSTTEPDDTWQATVQLVDGRWNVVPR